MKQLKRAAVTEDLSQQPPLLHVGAEVPLAPRRLLDFRPEANGRIEAVTLSVALVFCVFYAFT